MKHMVAKEAHGYYDYGAAEIDDLIFHGTSLNMGTEPIFSISAVE
jgi:hypothetical protein